jgi:hypothetical protein
MLATAQFLRIAASGMRRVHACDDKASDGFGPVIKADPATERAPRGAVEERYPFGGDFVPGRIVLP